MTERWIVDASVVAKIYLKDEEHADLAEDLLTRYAAGSVELFAPQLFLYEVPNATLSAVRRGRLNDERGAEAVREFFELRIPTVGDDASLPSMVQAAVDLAGQANCSTYDALYLVAAHSLGVPFITADAKLHRALSRSIDYITWVGDYEPPESST